MNNIVYDDDALSAFAPKFKQDDDSLALDSTPPREIKKKKIRQPSKQVHDGPVVEVQLPAKKIVKKKKVKKQEIDSSPPQPPPVQSVTIKKVLKKKKKPVLAIKPPPMQKRESTPAPGRRSATPNQIDVDLSVIEEKVPIEARGRSPSVFQDPRNNYQEQLEKLKMELMIAQKEKELDTIRQQETQQNLQAELERQKLLTMYQNQQNSLKSSQPQVILPTPKLEHNIPLLQQQDLEIQNLKAQILTIQNPDYIQNIIKQELNRQQQQKMSFLQTDTTYCQADLDLKPAKPSDLSIFDQNSLMAQQQAYNMIQKRPKQQQQQQSKDPSPKAQRVDISIGPSIYRPSSKELENQSKMRDLEYEILQLKKDQQQIQQKPQDIISIVQALKPTQEPSKLKTELSAYMQEIKNLNEQQFMYQKQIQNELRTSQISQENQARLDKEKLDIENQKLQLQRQQYEFQLKQQEILQSQSFQQTQNMYNQQAQNFRQNGYNQLISTFAHSVNGPKRPSLGESMRFLMADLLK
ncbi:hypothetical protein SS50377_23568 [Spironucleus salmonicida]|nr:hypothetical protein SS50377_23568 [Spironucleus salmonicida]